MGWHQYRIIGERVLVLPKACGVYRKSIWKGLGTVSSLWRHYNIIIRLESRGVGWGEEEISQSSNTQYNCFHFTYLLLSLAPMRIGFPIFHPQSSLTCISPIRSRPQAFLLVFIIFPILIFNEYKFLKTVFHKVTNFPLTEEYLVSDFAVLNHLTAKTS